MASRASELIEGPRGRRALYELARGADEGLDGFAWDVEHGFRDPASTLFASWGSRGGDEPAARPSRAETLGEVAERIAERAVGYPIDVTSLVGALTASVDAARPWQDPDAIDAMLSDPAFDNALALLAGRIAEMPGTAWWWDPVLDEQTVMRFFYENTETRTLEAPHPPEPRATHAQLARWRADGEKTEERFVDHAIRHPGAALAGEWWALPQYCAVWTTPRLAGRDPAGLHFVEDSAGESRARVWPAQAGASARVLEIAGPEGWAELCRGHPFDVSESRRFVWADATGRHGRWVVPDWPAVAGEWDAVHVTVTGYLRAAGRAIPVTDDTATVLAGWGPGATAWLTGALEITGDPTDWIYEDIKEAWEPVG